MPKLTEDQLTQIEAALQSKFDQVDNGANSPENVNLMGQIADLIDDVRGADDDDDDDDDPAPAAAVASGSRRAATSDLGRAGALARKSGGTPRVQGQNLSGVAKLLDSRGEAITSEDELATRFAAALNSSRSLPRDGTTVVASATFDFPEDRRLDTDGIRSTKKLDAVLSPSALVAAGGICAPVNIDYSVFTIGTSERPLRDGLPQFQADRGGLTYLLPPTLAATAAGVGIWTPAMDVAALTDPSIKKPRVRLNCGSSATVLVEAITERAVIGNLASRFQPEMMGALLSTLGVNAARTAELNLLGKIATASTPVSGSQLLGATRDLLPTIDLSVAAYRFRQRIPRTLRLTAIFPDFVKDMVRADLARQMATDANPLAVSDDEIAAYFTARNLNVIWLLDGLPTNATGVPFPFQGFAAQGANTGLVDWPHTITWWLFAPGTFVYLDGGSLDVGVVRDSALNDTNDAEIFQETFETIAVRGLSSIQVVSTVRPNGLSAGTINTSAY
jgi:hypothetical protein